MNNNKKKMDEKHLMDFSDQETNEYDKEEVLINYIEAIQSVQCEILQSGIKESEGTYYICECDPERMRPICSNCFLKCHKGGQEGLHKEIRSGTMNAVCICGYKCHKPLSELGTCDIIYKTECSFGEMGKIPDLNFFFLHPDEPTRRLCLFCKNVCYKNDPKLTRDCFSSARGFICKCMHHNHSDIRIIFRKLKSLAKHKNFIVKYNFEGMSFIQFVNIFLSSKKSYNNLFHSFSEQIASTEQRLQTLTYGFENHNILNDLHLTCQILLIFSEKCKQVYKYEYKPMQIEQENTKINTNMNLQDFKPMTADSQKLPEKQRVKIRGQSFYYFNDVIKNILNANTYYKIMERKFDYKSRNIWQLKYFLTQIFWTYHVSRDFAFYPHLKIRDIVLLSPLQRLLLISNLDTERKVSHYVNNLNMNYLNLTLSAIESIFNCDEKSVNLLLILSRLYKICLLFAKYSLFNHEQVAKICSLNDSILAYFDEEKQEIERDFTKLKIISPMIKMLVFLSYYYNDQIILSVLKGDVKIDNANFFHGKTDICKSVTQNAILVMTFLQRFDEKVIIKEKKTKKEKKKNNKQFAKKDALKKMDETLPKVVNNIRCFRNVLRNCNVLLQLPLELNEYYISSLVRLIDTNQEILFKCIKGNLMPNEKDFVKKIKYLTEELERLYLASFQEINSKIYEDKITQKYEDIICEFEKNLISVNEVNSIDKKRTHFQDNDNLLIEESINDSSYNNRDNNEISMMEHDGSLAYIKKSNLVLLNKSFFLQSMMKYFQIIFHYHIAQKYCADEFQLKQSIFQKTIEILSNYINGNVDHCMFILQSDFTTCFELLNNKQLLEALQFVYTVVEIISLSKRDIASNTNLLHFLKVATLKSTDLTILHQILKLLQLICFVNFTDELNVKKKIRKICKVVFANNDAIKSYFQSLVNKENDKFQCFKKQTEKIIKKFVRIINCIFNEKELLEEKEFLNQILSKNQIKIILYTKSLNISLRIELLQFYRMNYIETLIEKKNINYFSSLLLNDLTLDKKDEIIENPKLHKFFEYIVKSGAHNSVTAIEQEANVIKHELLHFQEVLTITTNKEKIRNYIEVLIKSIIVFFEKFSSLIFESSGFNCLSLYEMIYYFLEFKKFIYARKEVFITSEEQKKHHCKMLFARKIFFGDKEELPLIDGAYLKKESISNKQDKNYEKEINKRIKIHKMPKTDEERVYYDLKRLSDENFEFLNYPLMRTIFNNHTKKFIQLPKVKGFKKYFEKKSEIYSDVKIKAMEKTLKEQNKLNTPFDYLVFNIIIKYFNMKTTIDKSTFIKALEESNTHYNTSFKMLLCKVLIYYFNDNEGKMHDNSLWYLFRLLQYHTTGIQETFVDIIRNTIDDNPLFDFNTIVGNITSSTIAVFLREINPHSVALKKEYYNAVMNLKIMKYFCEEHNQIFQTYFFNNTYTGQGQVIVYYKLHLRPLRSHRVSGTKLEFNKKTINSINGNGNAIPYHKRLNKSNTINSQAENSSVYNRKASVFEYFISILGKIILLSKWINSREEHPDEYLYDLYFGILEFLIETIQGSSTENLVKVFAMEKKKNLFGKFLSDISALIGDDTLNSKLHVSIRKDMMDFLMAFLEESATPSIGVNEISSVILPMTVLESILATMSKLYDEKTSTKMQEEHKIEKEKKGANPLKRIYNFTPEMRRFFTSLYFNDMSIGKNTKFSLANKMYQYFKMLGQSSTFKNPYISEFFLKMNMFTEAEVNKAYSNQKDKLINKITKAKITDNRFIDQYLCVSFFESITKTVFVNKPGEDEPARVIFTINPIVLLLSKISKDDFNDNVLRTDRYTKLFCLMERIDNFFEEISYKQIHGKSNYFIRMITDINFYYLEVMAFCITLGINLIMVIILQGEGDVLFGDNNINYVLTDLGIANLVFNSVSVMLWLISKYNLLYMTECQKMLKAYKLKQYEDEEEHKVILMTKDKLKAAFIVLIEKNKLFAFFWNILFSAVASFTQVYFIYIFQLFIIFNLSQTLRNLLTSLTLKARQLSAVFYCSVVFNLVLATIAFFRFEEDFLNKISEKMPHVYPDQFNFVRDIIGGVLTEPEHIESECGTLIYCFATHLDYGMRFDGGIADRMMARSFNLNKSLYTSRFFYEEFYFILQTVLFQGMIFGIVIEAFSELRNQEQTIEQDKSDNCFICGIDKEACEKNGQRFEDHIKNEHNMWTYVEYILCLRFIDIQDTNAINSYVIKKIEKKELDWFPISKESQEGESPNKED